MTWHEKMVAVQVFCKQPSENVTENILGKIQDLGTNHLSFRRTFYLCASEDQWPVTYSKQIKVNVLKINILNHLF